MKKLLITAITIGIGIVLAGAVYAWCPQGEYGMTYGTVNEQKLKNFQKESLSLREELFAKRIELENEYNNPNPDPKRIATLRKEIIDIKTKIRDVAAKYGFPSRGYMTGYMMGRGMMGPMYGCQMGW